MNNIPNNTDRKQRPNLLDTSDININNDDDFLSDLNSTVVDDINHTNQKKIQAEIDKKQKEIEKREKNKNIIPIIITILAVIIAIIITILIILKIISSGNYTLNVMDSGIVVAQQPIFEDTSNKFLIDNKNNNDNNNTTDAKYNIVKQSDINLFEVGQTLLIDVTVNTKEAWEDTFNDHETQFYFTYSNFEIGYDNVIKYVEEYNSTSNKQIKLPSKNDYKASNMELVMIEFKVAYPSNFPTYNSDGKVFVIPDINPEIKGLCSELLEDDSDLINSLDKYIVVNEFVYDIADVISINNKLTEADKNTEYIYRYIASLPCGTTTDLYNIELEFTIKDKPQKILAMGLNIPASTNIENILTTNNEDIENNNEEIEKIETNN